VQVLIVDDHPLFRAGLEGLVRSICGDAEVLQAACLASARACGRQDFDLVLLDLHLPGTDPSVSLSQARELFETACLVVVSGQDDATTIHDCISRGAAGFIPKDTEPGLTEQALRLVLADGIYLPPKAFRAPQRAEPPGRIAPQLSPRQHAVLRSLLQGKSNKLIAREIGIAEGTVKAHLWSVYQVLGVQSRAQAMYVAHQLGMFGG
jgi:DNA-binding NarL/FixJ family response regulator